jgi:hypothetical protein
MITGDQLIGYIDQRIEDASIIDAGAEVERDYRAGLITAYRDVLSYLRRNG